MKQFGAGELVAGRAELMATGGKHLTVLNGASKTSVRLVCIIAAATGTWVVISLICTTKAAIQAARCNDFRIVYLNLRDFRSHAYLLVLRLRNDAQWFALLALGFLG